MADLDELAARIAALEAEEDEEEGGWMSDVQRTLAILLVGTFTLLTVMFAFRLMFSAEATTAGALLKELKDALVQMVMMALGFFLGNTMGKMAQDKASQKVVDKLTPPPTGTGNGALEGNAMRAAVAAAAMAAPAAAAVAAPAAAAVAAPPAAEIAAPPVVEEEVAEVVPREVAKQVAAAVAASKEVEKQK